MKIVERAGENLHHSRHKINPFDSEDCERTDCLSCNSAIKDDKNNAKDCHKRSVVYETIENEVENKCKDADTENRNSVKGPRGTKQVTNYYKYIGESSRSVYE